MFANGSRPMSNVILQGAEVTTMSSVIPPPEGPVDDDKEGGFGSGIERLDALSALTVVIGNRIEVSSIFMLCDSLEYWLFVVIVADENFMTCLVNRC
mmetsp:Transcript_20172/g.31175  ORF Transcript_20172/g.31175 Transcript_20172/m.31175 type:complete len:97 (+) Transcript_20172:707-997(+)